MDRYFLLLLLAGFFFCLSLPSSAQSFLSNEGGAATSDQAPLDIPRAYLEESMLFERYCKQDVNLYRYYNCECFAARFLDERIKLGPDATRNTIKLNIEDTCQDTTLAVGNEFEKCMKNTLVLPMNMDPEAYCKCFANNFGKIYEDSKMIPSAQNLTRAQTKAHVYCRKPGIAETLYKDNQ